MTTFGAKVRQAREAQHFSQEALAMATKLSRRTIQNVEAGQTASPETMRSLMAVLNITTDQSTAELPPVDDTKPTPFDEEANKIFRLLEISLMGMLGSMTLGVTLVPLLMVGEPLAVVILTALAIAFFLSMGGFCVVNQRLRALRVAIM